MSRDDEDMMLRAHNELEEQRRRILELESNLQTVISMVETARAIAKGQMMAFGAQILPIPPELAVSALFDLHVALGGDPAANDRPGDDNGWEA